MLYNGRANTRFAPSITPTDAGRRDRRKASDKVKVGSTGASRAMAAGSIMRWGLPSLPPSNLVRATKQRGWIRWFRGIARSGPQPTCVPLRSAEDPLRIMLRPRLRRRLPRRRDRAKLRKPLRWLPPPCPEGQSNTGKKSARKLTGQYTRVEACVIRSTSWCTISQDHDTWYCVHMVFMLQNASIGCCRCHTRFRRSDHHTG